MRRRNPNFFDMLFRLPWWVNLVLCFTLGVIAFVVAGTPAQKMLPVLIAKLILIVAFIVGLLAVVQFVIIIFRKILFASANDIERVCSLSWQAFEELIAESGRREGFAVTLTGGGGADGGVDVIFKKRDTKTLVQCKQWREQKVGVRIVREMYGIMIAEHATSVRIVTSGSFTMEAHDFAHGKPIDLIDGRKLMQWIRPQINSPQPTTHQASRHTTALTHAAQNDSYVSDQQVPSCPNCGSPMVLRQRKDGSGAFFGCSHFPKCRGIRNI